MNVYIGLFWFSLFHLQCYVLFRLLTSGFKSLKIAKGGNQNPYIEEEQTTQRPKEKVQMDKQ